MGVIIYTGDVVQVQGFGVGRVIAHTDGFVNVEYSSGQVAFHPYEEVEHVAPRIIFAGEDGIGQPDPVNHPSHYTSHPSGVECIQVTEHMGFNLGNVVKYVWRSDLKGDAIEDLRKARFYLDREIEKREQA